MYCPPLRPSPLYSFAMIFIFLWVKWFDK
jgi:hypothetical protein